VPSVQPVDPIHLYLPPPPQSTSSTAQHRYPPFSTRYQPPRAQLPATHPTNKRTMPSLMSTLRLPPAVLATVTTPSPSPTSVASSSSPPPSRRVTPPIRATLRPRGCSISKKTAKAEKAEKAARRKAYKNRGKRPQLAPASSPESDTETPLLEEEEELPVVQPLVSPFLLPLPMEEIMAMLNGPGSGAALRAGLGKRKRDADEYAGGVEGKTEVLPIKMRKVVSAAV
ncbi:hypothetical protein EDC01DRAFT_752808, partial [Geopyxis carbonaria]